MIVILVVTGRKSTNRHATVASWLSTAVGVARVSVHCELLLLVALPYLYILYTWDIYTVWRRGAGPGPSCRSTVQDFGNICVCRVPYRTSYRERACHTGFSVLVSFGRKFTNDDPPLPATHLCRLPSPDDPPLSFALF